MNNLLRALASSHTELHLQNAPNALANPDLRLLYNTVKEARRQQYDKLSDAFYESLEAFLHDLRTVTMDNRDAEAFLKPVAKAEAPDYYDVIANPMDLGTMLKKVKNKSYKSKREFQDDLDLIWSNCFTYNATENHPLRQCASRLKEKADKLLRHITDRKDRIDPDIPANLALALQSSATASSSKSASAGSPNDRAVANGKSKSPSSSPAPPPVNGVNANGHVHAPSISPGPSFSQRPLSPRPLVPHTSARSTSPVKTAIAQPRHKASSFADSPALIRTPAGMATFARLDAGLDAGPSREWRMGIREYVPEAFEGEESDVVVKDEDHDEMDVDDASQLGYKRKLSSHSQTRPRKRSRPRAEIAEASQRELDIWWNAVGSDAFIANGLPPTYHTLADEEPSTSGRLTNIGSTPADQVRNVRIRDPPRSPLKSKATLPKSPKKRKAAPKDPQKVKEGAKGSLLTIMDDNIRTMRRVRQAHGKLLEFKESQANEDGAEGEDGIGGPNVGGKALAVTAPGPGVPPALEDVAEEEEPRATRRWRPTYVVSGSEQRPNGQDSGSIGVLSHMGQAKGENAAATSQDRHPKPASDVEINEQAAEQCLNWMSGKVLEHVGFQGTSKVALSVISSVASEYLFNVGRTIRYLSDKYSHRMSAEEIILHTLFESGTNRVQDLERYITDDIVRHGTRMSELEKRLESAYAEATAGETFVDDDALFGKEEDENEDGAFVMGNFTDALGEDFLGLRELGIADEFGLSSLSVPKKLLKAKNRAEQAAAAAAAKPAEPPLPFPPPPPFIPLDSTRIDDQIGLLRSYYQRRVQAIKPNVPVPLPPTMGTSLLPPPPPGIYGVSSPLLQPPMPPPIPPLVVLQDDPIDSAQTKIGPIGQITKPTGTSGGAKKKSKGKDKEPKDKGSEPGPKEADGGPAGDVAMSPTVTFVGEEASGMSPVMGAEATKRKKTGGGSAGATPGALGTGAKRKGKGLDPPAPMVMASA
ncbi:hypothetical protein PUNSTDRAFT_89966 [Punctularia strigosozonata HHB-11173 SS5]|uniref:uncharacterized protein n=1 Tax=Punctularia strigosozonata (strain HHB-11173) TaxID=741275 RepID=UPI0004417BAF|nr:uncharacterized protein PUNSTDRAFT_89966 [Punctularia strigosozonata HHB-11173 SS5]EIN06408.1 hypothetical protein PUNSTDRAFT_89966 [Punctularia strigosozonata HHB-11173 SS5]